MPFAQVIWSNTGCMSSQGGQQPAISFSLSRCCATISKDSIVYYQFGAKTIQSFLWLFPFTCSASTITRSVHGAESLDMSQLAVSGKLLAAEKVAGAAAPSIDPFRYSSTLQNATIGITIAFAALAFIVVCTRVAGRLSSHQFGLGKKYMMPMSRKSS